MLYQKQIESSYLDINNTIILVPLQYFANYVALSSLAPLPPTPKISSLLTEFLQPSQSLEDAPTTLTAFVSLYLICPIHYTAHTLPRLIICTTPPPRSFRHI